MKKHLKKIVRKLDTQNKSEFDFVLNQSERITKLQFIDFNKFIQNLI
jgi:DNA recombination-dependent growth factor C